MEPTSATDWNRDDRDLLVELRTEMRGVRTDIKNLSDGNNARLTLLEQGKLDRTEANRLQSESLSVHTKHEERLNAHAENIEALQLEAAVRDGKTKTYFQILIAVVTLLQLVSAGVQAYYSHH